jgi:hypothetical protein
MSGCLQVLLANRAGESGTVVDNGVWEVDIEATLPTNATSGLRLNTDGTTSLVKTGVTITNTLQNWYSITESGIGNSKWVEAAVGSGDTPSGTIGSRVALTSSQSWTLTGTQTCVLNITFYNQSSGGSSVGDAAVTLTATTLA